MMGWVRGGGGQNGEKKFGLKCFSGKKSVLRPSFFLLMENRDIKDPPSQFIGKFHYFFFETVPNIHPM